MEDSLFRKELFELKDEDYREFNSKLVPDIDKERVIGVRVPKLRKLAKHLYKNRADDVERYLKSLPHHYLEENHLHILLIAEIKDFQKAVDEAEKILPYIDNWETCDLFSPKIFKKNPDRLYPYIEKWIESDLCYTKRFAICMLMGGYLDENFRPVQMKSVADIKSGYYYVNMAVAWYFCEALSKQYEYAIEYIENGKLQKWTHNKTIQKAVESRKIEPWKKEYLRTLKIK